jgi:hypothetical protein
MFKILPRNKKTNFGIYSLFQCLRKDECLNNSNFCWTFFAVKYRTFLKVSKYFAVSQDNIYLCKNRLEKQVENKAVSFQPQIKGPAGCAPLRVSALGSREVPPDDRPGAQRTERSFPGAAVSTALQPRCREGGSQI